MRRRFGWTSARREAVRLPRVGEGERIVRRFGVLFTALLVLRTERPLQFSPLPAHSEVVTLWELALNTRRASQSYQIVDCTARLYYYVSPICIHADALSGGEGGGRTYLVQSDLPPPDHQHHHQVEGDGMVHHFAGSHNHNQVAQ